MPLERVSLELGSVSEPLESPFCLPLSNLTICQSMEVHEREKGETERGCISIWRGFGFIHRVTMWPSCMCWSQSFPSIQAMYHYCKKIAFTICLLSTSIAISSSYLYRGSWANMAMKQLAREGTPHPYPYPPLPSPPLFALSLEKFAGWWFLLHTLPGRQEVEEADNLA